MSSSHPTSSLDNRHLILRVYREDQLGEEHYIANGLSIGRSEANQIQVDETGIGRAHARISRSENGHYILRPVSSELAIKQNGKAVPEIALTSGQQFEIGSVQFECFSSKPEPAIPQATNLPCCPHCRVTIQTSDDPWPQSCDHCSARIMIVRHTPGSSQRLALPSQYGKYQVERYVARGGMGLVFLGFKTDDPAQNVAIKVLKAANTGVTTSDMQLFRSEIALMRQIDNPHVMPLLSYGNSQRHNYLVMPWLGSPTLREKVALWKSQQTPMRFEEALPLFWGICQGVQAIHAQRIVHRDLKPANILFDASELPIVADLGIAQSNQIGQGETKTGMILGSSDYMSPEQRWQHDKVDQRSDLYALGVIFYEVLTLSYPSGAWLPASAINSSVPQQFDFLITALLAATPDKRVASIEALISWLKVWNFPPQTESNKDGDFPSPSISDDLTLAPTKSSPGGQQIEARATEHVSTNPTVVTSSPQNDDASREWWLPLLGSILLGLWLGNCNTTSDRSKNPTVRQQITNTDATPIGVFSPSMLQNYEPADKTFKCLHVANPTISRLGTGQIPCLGYSAYFSDDKVLHVIVSEPNASETDFRNLIKETFPIKVISTSDNYKYPSNEVEKCLLLIGIATDDEDARLKSLMVRHRQRWIALVAIGRGLFVYQQTTEQFLESLR